MRAMTTASLACFALTAAAAPARADNSVLAVRDTQGLPPYTSDIGDHGVNCVGSGCVDNPDGSRDVQGSYAATVRARSMPHR